VIFSQVLRSDCTRRLLVVQRWGRPYLSTSVGTLVRTRTNKTQSIRAPYQHSGGLTWLLIKRDLVMSTDDFEDLGIAAIPLWRLCIWLRSLLVASTP
jgi:hypothetical protein